VDSARFADSVGFISHMIIYSGEEQRRRARRRASSFSVACVCGFLCLSTVAAVIAYKVELRDLEGTWRADVMLPGGIRVQIRTVIGQGGGYMQYLTNKMAGEERFAVLAGKVCIGNGHLVETITNDLTANTVVPRLAGVWRLVDLSGRRLTLADTNTHSQVLWLRD